MEQTTEEANHVKEKGQNVGGACSYLFWFHLPYNRVHLLKLTVDQSRGKPPAGVRLIFAHSQLIPSMVPLNGVHGNSRGNELSD